MPDTTGESATPRRAGRTTPRPAGAAAQALYRFLTAEAADREHLAPRVAAAVGRARLDEIVDVTLARIGAVTRIRDSRDGLVIEGATGRALAFAASQDGLRLDELLIRPGAYRPPRLRIPPEVRGAFGWTVLALLLVLRIEACWEAPSRLVWCGRVLMVVAGYVALEGWFTPARLPWWIRRPVEAGALVAPASAWRLPGLPVSGGNAAEPVVGVVLVGVFGALLVRARRHRWGTAVSRPLAFPLRGGSWYIAQGGGRGLNHHFAFPEQRGALDILQVGPGGARARHRARGDRAGGKNMSHLVYGQPVHAPCDGTVVSAADHIDDQEPGLIRYQPRYGNHVWIDTGAEIVKLAHLRPGTVTVAKGDTVRAGQVLGEVGNSGNSTEPHLHIHAERDGVGLDLEFEGVPGPLCRGRTVRSGTTPRPSSA